MTPSADPRSLPLRPAVYHILLALASGNLHGLGIAEEVESATEGVIDLGPGTLYRSLAELTEAGLIELVAAPDKGADPRRKYYAIRPEGRRLVARETARLRKVVDVATARIGLQEGA